MPSTSLPAPPRPPAAGADLWTILTYLSHSATYQNQAMLWLAFQEQSLMHTEADLQKAIQSISDTLASEDGAIATLLQQIQALQQQAASQPVSQDQLDQLATLAQNTLTHAQSQVQELQQAAGGGPGPAAA